MIPPAPPPRPPSAARIAPVAPIAPLKWKTGHVDKLLRADDSLRDPTPYPTSARRYPTPPAPRYPSPLVPGREQESPAGGVGHVVVLPGRMIDDVPTGAAAP